MNQPFNQPAPELGNQYEEDRVLRSYLTRIMPADVLREIEPSLKEIGELAGGELYQMQLADRLNEPILTQWDAWGERIDHIELTPVWQRAEQLAAQYGVVAAAHEKTFGRYSRPYQFALAYIFHPSTDIYTCPLAMTDGAIRTLLRSGNQKLIDRAVPRLTSRDPQQFWSSGQWMTESTGGSDVGTSETIARQDQQGTWRLYGRKWFTSAATSPMALTLGRPEGNPPRGKGLALFYLETRDENNRLQNIFINRLKDKLGTRKLPTAELSLEGTPAELVMGDKNGVANMVPMLHITRTWNSVMTAAAMRRGIALARDYARKRQAFGALLSQKLLHLDTMAMLQAETEAAFHLSFYLVELLGLDENDGLSEEQTHLFRLLTSIVKLTTGKQVMGVVSEVIEVFAGAGYVEDTGLPVLLRDSQVFPIWEGTTNVLSLDVLRALRDERGLIALKKKADQSMKSVKDHQLAAAVRIAQEALKHGETWLKETQPNGQPLLEAGARRFALTLGRSLALALLLEHAQWSLENEGDGLARAAALRFARSGIDLISPTAVDESAALANDERLPI